jgi:hypothetical protein
MSIRWTACARLQRLMFKWSSVRITVCFVILEDLFIERSHEFYSLLFANLLAKLDWPCHVT